MNPKDCCSICEKNVLLWILPLAIDQKILSSNKMPCIL